MSTAPLTQISGLQSGLDTASIIQELMQIEEQPRNGLQQQVTQITARDSILSSFKTQLASLQTAAQALSDPTLYSSTQDYTSSDDTKVSISSTTGAGVGTYEIGVSQLASASQRTFTFVRPTADGTITIDGHATAVRAGETAQELAADINSDRDATVFAAATDDGTLVLSSRSSGDLRADADRDGLPDDPEGYIQVDDGAGGATLTEQTAKKRIGRDAMYTIDGQARTSHSNVVTDGIDGLSITLKATTTANGPASVSVGAPGADTEAIERALQGFVDTYNATVTLIQARLNERTVPDPRTADDIARAVPDPRSQAQLQQGMLFNDEDLEELLSHMRETVYEPVDGLPRDVSGNGLSLLSELGISTGKPGSVDNSSQDTLNGMLSFDRSRLEAELTSDPDGVRNLLAGVAGTDGWARRMSAEIDSAIAAGTGTLDIRTSGDSDELRALNNNISDWNERLTNYQTSLQAQFTAMEVAMSQTSSQSSWLDGQIASL
ncbi:MAG TPA: flagellar filament capping protein FliD [Conexibacter sp.]|jgi:flagellar hook-associated protein 2